VTLLDTYLQTFLLSAGHAFIWAWSSDVRLRWCTHACAHTHTHTHTNTHAYLCLRTLSHALHVYVHACTHMLTAWYMCERTQALPGLQRALMLRGTPSSLNPSSGVLRNTSAQVNGAEHLPGLWAVVPARIHARANVGYHDPTHMGGRVV